MSGRTCTSLFRRSAVAFFQLSAAGLDRRKITLQGKDPPIGNYISSVIPVSSNHERAAVIADDFVLGLISYHVVYGQLELRAVAFRRHLYNQDCRLVISQRNRVRFKEWAGGQRTPAGDVNGLEAAGQG